MNHLMTVSITGPSLRQQHAADTRRRILDAVAALLTEGHPAALSVPAVAKRAGASVATVYRYFPNKEQLLDAAAELGTLPAPLGFRPPADAASLHGLFVEAAKAVQATAPLLRAQIATNAGRQVRRHRQDDRRAAVRNGLEQLGVDVDSPEGERATRIVWHLAGSAAMLDLLEQPGATPERIAGDITWALLTLAAASRPTRSRQR